MEREHDDRRGFPATAARGGRRRTGSRRADGVPDHRRVARRAPRIEGWLLAALAVAWPLGPASADETSTRARCGPPDADERTLVYSDFSWYYAPDELADKFDEIYASGKRLPDRARWDDDSGGYRLIHRGRHGSEPVPVTDAFIGAVRSHVERALALGYAEHVIFPDMGHAHLLIDRAYYDDVVRHAPPTRFHRLYADVLSRPETRFLYHTAEQLGMLDEERRLKPDKYLGWRYFTRNLVARNDELGLIDIHHDLESVGNTVCDVDGSHRYFSAGFHVSASVDGCFPFSDDGRTYYFDISLSDLPLGPDERAWLGADAERSGGDPSTTASRLWGAHGCAE